MAFRLLSYFCLFFIVFYHSIESTNNILRDDYSLLNSYDKPLVQHPLNFISHMCQRQEQYPSEITKKFCTGQFQSYESQQEQQEQQRRGKRVGWTISV